MIKKWFSAYTLRYPRYIVYMLQASEYKISSYLNWRRNLRDFRRVEVRKKFVKTPKSYALLIIAWCITIATVIGAVALLITGTSALKYFWFASVLILLPYILGFGILIPLFAIEIIIQRPIDYFIIKMAKETLQNHRGLKIGIAGSFGKTTMREILKTVLGEEKVVAAPPHNYNTLLGISSFAKTLTGKEDILILELGEYYKGDIQEMCELVNPSIGIITGVNEAHLEKFKDISTTVSTIFELSDWLGDKPLYINGENSLAREYALKKDHIYSRKGVAELTVENSHSDLNGTSFSLVKNGEKFEFKSKLLGLHQVGPLVAVIKLALDLGISMESIQRGVARTQAFDHRLEPHSQDGVITLDDSYNGNPDGVKAVIEFFGSLAGKRRFYVTPGLVEMGDRTEAVHVEIGKQLSAAGIEKVVLIKNSVTPFIEQGLKLSGYAGDIVWFEDSLKAFSALPYLTVSGDIVLLQNDWPDQYY